MGLEGIVSKQMDRAYRAGRCAHRPKIKNPDSPELMWVGMGHGKQTEVLMAEEKLDGFFPKQGYSVEAGTFTLDLYRLVCMFLADRQIAKHTVTFRSIDVLQEKYFKTEVTRILTSCATGIRILFDNRPTFRGVPDRSDCGKLYPNWANDQSTFEVLTIREACNKIIHATDIRFDVVIPDRQNNPDQEGTYHQPSLYLYGSKNRNNWRAELSILDFTKWGTAAFLRWQ